MSRAILIVLSLIVSVVICEGEETEIGSNETLKIMPLSMQSFSEGQWPSGLVISYSEEDEKQQKECYTLGQLLSASSHFSHFKAVMDRLGVLQDLERADIPNFTLLTPTNHGVVQFVRRIQQRKNLLDELDYMNATAVADYLKVEQWDTAVSLMILPDTWQSFTKLMSSHSKLGTLMHKDSFYWKFRKLDDGTIKLRFELKKKEEAIDEILRPVLVGIVYKDIRTCNGWMQVVDSMPF
eukprot:TRINITY_DN18454_c0_g1_i1.p1 TRINITY_DN18454_c0_g1~~TRINITY_DN18454_c0_g1_i1.p1  ORF type:complete len:238 (+),score=34.31 TRINITY_DN18454_c0_g1_i1:51-764(+)